MNAVSLLNSVVFSGKPYYGFSTLPHGNYKIEKIKVVSNKHYKANDRRSFQQSLMVEIADQVLFLPNYFTASFVGEDGLVVDEKIAEVNASNLFMYFGGARPDR